MAATPLPGEPIVPVLPKYAPVDALPTVPVEAELADPVVPGDVVELVLEVEDVLPPVLGVPTLEVLEGLEVEPTLETEPMLEALPGHPA